MRKRALRLTLILLTGIAAFASSHSRAQQPVASPGPELVQEYCVGCHNKAALTGGLSLEGLDFNKVGENADVLEKVLRKLQTGQMPPAGLPRPSPAAVASFTGWLESALDQAATAHPNPGRPAVHRLNRAEYSNAVRDLLAIDIKPGDSLPVDDSGYGFDNIGDVLSVSPALLEKYIAVSRRVSRLAVGDLSMKPTEDRFRAHRGGRRDRVSDDLPFYSRGGIAFQYYFPLDAEYTIKIKVPNGDESRSFDLRLPLKAGLRNVSVALPRDSAKPEVGLPARRGGGGNGAMSQPPLTIRMDLRIDGATVKRFDVPDTTDVDMVIIGGPFNATARGETPSRSRIFVCHPFGKASAAEERACAGTILGTIARRAFRRTVKNGDLEPLLAFYESGRRGRDFDSGIQSALEAVLVSPEFLMRIEHDPRGAAAGSVYRLNDFELASRLSFFLWSSIPDDQLLDIAEKGKLGTPDVLMQQVRRMLDDPRSAALVTNFGGQWLYLRNLENASPDPDIFPGFDDSLRQAFRQETELFFDSIVRENHSLLDLLDAKYTFLNQRLAEHYGIHGVYGSQFRRVELDNPNRGGLLGQASILTVTSYPNRTSVVLRGKWVLENLLGSPPPPPPAVVPNLKPHGTDGRELSLRQQMEQHRVDAVCASCHVRMDPIGFALENYDAVGRWRAKDAGVAIDASGKLPDGTQFSGPAELKKVLLSRHRDEFVTTVTEKLMTYALGRGLESYDNPAIREVVREAARDDYRFQNLVAAIIKSTPFEMRRTPTQ
jgi:mono/diheme cytochrome c family protein